MSRSQALLFWWIAAAALPAFAASPGPSTRQGLLPLGECAAGPLAGEACVDAFDCESAGVTAACTTPVSEVAVRGILTLIADKDSGRWDDLEPVPQAVDNQGVPIPADTSKSTLTVMLEFTRNGKKFLLAETYRDLTNYSNPALGINCRGFCVPTWREPAVEGRIALPSVGEDDAGSGGGGGGGGGGGSGGGGGQNAGALGVRIPWATGGDALQAALVDALELPAGSVAFLEAATDTELFPHSAQDDLLASVHRMKVTIRAVLPASP
jgi:hypothetical protein